MSLLSHVGRSRHWFGALFGIICISACSPSSLIDVKNPGNTIDPSQVKTPAVATQMRTGALLRSMQAFGGVDEKNVLVLSATITDELTEAPPFAGYTGDARIVTKTGSAVMTASATAYDRLQGARVYAAQAREALQRYAANTPGVPAAWQGEMYSLEGYAILWLAELYCSGIPLSQAPLEGAQQATRGFTTEELFTRALALFDSALVAGADSAQFVHLASVGKARALLGLGQIAAADSAVRTVPTDFVYLLRSAQGSTDMSGYFMFPYFETFGAFRIQDQEGGNGLIWSTDPRTGAATADSVAGTMIWPAKYNVDSATGRPDPVTPHFGVALRLADGLEARLIEAEAALARGDATWLTILNTLRSTCVGTAPCAPLPGLTAASLPALSDPGSADTRLDLLMQERAMWLYLTGHREGDMRRLVRVYHRVANTVWPTGVISSPAFLPLWSQPGGDNGTRYGNDTVYQPDPQERVQNTLYGGCYDTTP